jgi:hypothetical protein
MCLFIYSNSQLPQFCPETEAGYIYWVKLGKFHEDGYRIQSPQRRVLNKWQDDG